MNGTTFKGISYISIANLGQKGIGAIFWFYMASMVGQENYGLLAYFLALSILVWDLSSIGIRPTNIVYTSKEKKSQVLLYPIPLFIVGITSVILSLISGNVFLGIVSFGLGVFSIITSELLGFQNYKRYMIFVISQRVIQITLSISLFSFMGFDGLILGYGLSFLLYIPFLYQSFKKFHFDFEQIKQKFKFMRFVYLENSLGALSTNLDKLIIGPLFGFGILGNYQLGVQVLMLMAFLPMAVMSFTLSHDTQGINTLKLKKLTVLTSILFSALVFFIGPIVLPILFPEFKDAKDAVEIIGLAIIPLTIVSMYTSSFYANEKPKLVSLSSLIFIVIQISLLLSLGSVFGIMGIASALLIAYTAQAIFLVVVYKQRNPSIDKSE